MKTIPYYPGCTLKATAKGFEETAVAVCRELGLELEEMENWYCCGTVHSLSSDDLIHHLAPIRNLLRVKAAGGGRLLTLCSMCYNTLKRADAIIAADPDKRQKVQSIMDREEITYDGGEVKVLHLMELLRDEVGMDAVSAKVQTGLNGLKVAPYYGCTLLRPKDIGIDDSENPVVFEDLLKAVDAEPVDFPWKAECCGSYLTVDKADIVALKTKEIIGSAARRGAEAIATSCPLCFYNLDERQRLAGDDRMPVFYFTELMALAFGLDVERYDLHFVDPRPLLASKKIAGAAV
jgi:heterodisulfide reductase subunit B2